MGTSISSSLSPPCSAGQYTESAHGDGTFGVSNRATGFASGNCAHCHEFHASSGGSEPAPVDGAASPFTLFTENFNTSATVAPYAESDNICFYCHRGTGCSFQQVTNYDYSRSFAGYTISTLTNILDTFNQTSYHNLYDIWNFYKDKSGADFFNDLSNPCVACHNPHLAKKNSADPTDPAQTCVSKPSDHETLWGDGASEQINDYTAAYQAPFFYNSSVVYEPGGSATSNGSLTPDYITFCTDCHNTTNTIYSTTLVRNLRSINWSTSGDVHGGGSARDAYSNKGTIKAPYDEASGPNYVLSCLDCHEPHGSSSKYLLRREVNGVAVPQLTVDTNTDSAWLTFCAACHDVTVEGVGNPCGSSVHGGYPMPGTSCVNCHYHGRTMCPPPFCKTM
ncbi:MAG: hypothetical protein HY885_00755 [Deltaproteobacteria bacterium]|nr:hypothetical protein [Deltaproteobacteria bacterium]